MKNLKPNAEKLLEIIRIIKTKGTKVYIVEGNWDNPDTSGVNYITEQDIKFKFDMRKYFTTHSISFIDKIETINTKTTLQNFF